MFAVTPSYEPLSTSVMRFQSLWIFDLRSYHSFWKESIQTKRPHLAQDDLIWRALLKAYGLHLFSPTEALTPFARDFHHHRRHSVSSKNIRDLFDRLRRLGLEKIGHLRRLPLTDFQKRFGKAWAEFFRGITEPERASWIWEPYRSQEPLVWSTDFDEPSVDALWILETLTEGLRTLAQRSPELRIQKLELMMQLSDPETVTLEFPHALCLRQDLLWIRHLLEERLTRLCLDAAVWRVSLKAFASETQNEGQLSLFEHLTPSSKTQSDIAWRNLCERLENQGFKIFTPLSKPSYVPETSWEMQSPLNDAPSFDDRGLFRPLIQTTPQAIPKPDSILKFTERLQWFDEKGEKHQRDYFVARRPRQWAWVFRDESDQWFQQGIVE